MEISLAEERAYYFGPRIALEDARNRVEKKKTTLVAGTFGNLISRPNPAEIQIVSVESRLEPYWVVSVATRTAYDRQQIYTLPLKGREIQEVTILGQKLTVSSKNNPSLTLNGLEHCVEEHRVTRYFDGLSGQKNDLSQYESYTKTEVTDLEHFAQDIAAQLVLKGQ